MSGKERSKKGSRRGPRTRKDPPAEQDDTMLWKRTLLFIAVLAVVLGGVVALFYFTRDIDEDSILDEGGPPGGGEHWEEEDPPEGQVFDFVVTDVDGNEFRLSNQTEKLIIVDLMATWCGPCTQELPHLEDVKDNLGSQVQIISVDVDLKESNAKLKEYRDDHNVAWPMARDTPGLGDKYNVQSIPTLLLFDQNGNLLKKWVGVTDSSSIIAECNKHL